MSFLFKIIGLCVLSTIVSFYMHAQRIEPGSTFKNIHQKKYIRFHYDNDFFTKTDYYYTQGIVLEYGNPGLKKLILSHLILKPAHFDTRYSVGFNLASYSPTSISSDGILYDDRPFAAIMSFSYNASATSGEKAERLSSSVVVGIIGPGAQGKQIQTGIHRLLKNILPHGWQHQVKNDIIINYDVIYEKKLGGAGDYILLNAVAAASLGTLTDKLSGGFNFMAGNFTDPYESTLKYRKIRYYVYSQVRANFIGYDATMQGGFFNRKSPYTLSAGDINRVTLQADAGVVINYRKTSITYSQSVLTKEFKTGRYHRWGGISIAVAF